MKRIIVNFLVHVLSLMVPLEDHLNAVIRKAATTKLAQEAEAALQAAEKRASAIVGAALNQAETLQAAAREEYAAAYRARQGLVTPVVSPQGAAAMVASAVIGASTIAVQPNAA